MNRSIRTYSIIIIEKQQGISTVPINVLLSLLLVCRDDTLLVQLTCSSHKYSEEEGDVELITLEPAVVEEKLELFFRMLERAKRFRE